MKIVTLGKEIQNNKRTRYALIIMKLEKINGNSIDDTITYYYSNNLDDLLKTKSNLREISIDKSYYLDLNIFDYQEMKYVR